MAVSDPTEVCIEQLDVPLPPVSICGLDFGDVVGRPVELCADAGGDSLALRWFHHASCQASWEPVDEKLLSTTVAGIEFGIEFVLSETRLKVEVLPWIAM